MLGDVERWHPADHYVLVDDKLRILDAVKQQWRERVTTVFVEQGHYAFDPERPRRLPARPTSTWGRSRELRRAAQPSELTSTADAASRSRSSRQSL